MKAKALIPIKLILYVVAASLVLTAFLTFCYMIPLDRANYDASMAEFDQEGWYTNVLEVRPGYAENFHSFEPSIQSTFDDMLNYAHAAGVPDKGPLYNAMAMETETMGNDNRYWHGYAGVLRILLLGFDCKEIKFLSFIFQFILVVLIAMVIREKEGLLLTALFLTQYILMMPLAVSVSVFFSFTIDISFLGILLYTLLNRKKPFDIEKVCFFFCTIGFLTCFFEELVYGVMSWGIVILWVLILFGKDKTPKDNVLTVIASGLSWILGYGGIWFMKWVIGSIVLGTNLIGNGIGSVLWRSSNTIDIEEEVSGMAGLLMRLTAIRLNYKYYFYTVYFLILAVWVAVVVFRLVKNKITKDSRIYALGLVALAPIAWYFVLSNHTYGHRFMTHRIFGFGIIAVLAIALLSAGVSSAKKKFSIQKACLFAVPLILGFVIANFIYEKYESKNVNVPGADISISDCEDSRLKIPYTPAFEVVESIGVSLKPEQSDGTYEFRLSDQNGTKGSYSVPMSLFMESSWQEIPVEWKVKPGKEYLLEIIPDCPEGTEGTVSIVIPGADMVGGLGSIKSDGKYEGFQITTWIKYRNRVRGREQVFYILTYFMVFMDLGLLLFSKRLEKTEQ